MLEIFSQMQSPFGQPLHRVRISLACNLSLSLPIDVKFSHDVQILVCIFFLLTRFFLGWWGWVTPTAKFFSNFRFCSNFRRSTIYVLHRFKLCAGCVHSEQRVSANTQPVRWRSKPNRLGKVLKPICFGTAVYPAGCDTLGTTPEPTDVMHS